MVSSNPQKDGHWLTATPSSEIVDVQVDKSERPGIRLFGAPTKESYNLGTM